MINKQDVEIVDTALFKFSQLVFSQLSITLKQHLAGRFINNIGRNNLAEQLFGRDRNKLKPLFFKFTDGYASKFPVGLDQNFSITGGNVRSSALTCQQIIVDALDIFGTVPRNFFKVVVMFQQLFSGITQGLEQHCRRQFTAAINPYPEQIFVIKIKIQPGTAIRDNAGAVKNLPAGMTFALIMGEKDPRRAM